MNRIHIYAAAAFLATGTAVAQETDEHAHTDHDSHESHDHDSRDHETHDHEADKKSVDGENIAADAPLQITPEIEAALNAGGEPAVVEVLGVVCDFCAKAMNKTFGKREEVAAVYIDLDSKTLNLVFKPAMTLSDDVIHSLVKKAGYKAAAIRRGEAALKGTGDAADGS